MKFSSFSIFFFLAASFSNAATYTLTNAAGNNSSVVVNSDGVRLTGDGSNATVIGSAAFGYFSSDAAVTSATSASSLVNSFSVFGTSATLFNSPTIPTNYLGLFSSQATLTGSSLDAFTGKSIYLIVSNAATIGGGSEFLVIKLNSQFGSSSNEPINSTFTLDTANTDYTVLLGSKNGPSLTAGGIDTTSEPSFQLVAVPEPSVALLGALGSLALLRRRRN